MFYVYVLRSLKDGKHYVGHTQDLDNRIEEHNRGKSKSVRGRGPFVLIYKEPYQLRCQAMKRERQIKSYKGGESFKQLTSNQTIDSMV